MKRVSIIIPLHNKGPFIRATLESVQAQTCPDWEVFVIENHSTDDGPAQVAAIAKLDPRIRLIQAPKEIRGPGAARNLGLDLAAGEWILFLDSDDLLQPTQLEAFLSEAGKSGAVDLVISRVRKFSDSPLDLEEPEKPACEGKTHAQLLDSTVAFAPWAVHTALVRRSILVPELRWATHLDRYLGEDIAFWFKILNRTSRWVCSQSAGALYRWKTSGCRTQNEDPVKWYAGLHHAVEENLRFMERHQIEPTPGQCESIMRLYEGLYFLAIHTGDENVARESGRLTHYWLNRRLQMAGWRKSLVARRLLGLRLFNFIKACIHSAQ